MSGPDSRIVCLCGKLVAEMHPKCLARGPARGREGRQVFPVELPSDVTMFEALPEVAIHRMTQKERDAILAKIRTKVERTR